MADNGKIGKSLLLRFNDAIRRVMGKNPVLYAAVMGAAAISDLASDVEEDERPRTSEETSAEKRRDSGAGSPPQNTGVAAQIAENLATISTNTSALPSERLGAATQRGSLAAAMGRENAPTQQRG